MSYEIIVLDLDGTLTDSMPGIARAVQYALRRFGIDVQDLAALKPFLGPPLRDSFMEFYGMSPEEANKKLLDATRLMTIATSLGEGCTLIQIEHSGMIRIAVGLENKEDLLRDLTQAFDALTR